jgi:hypothetical protein
VRAGDRPTRVEACSVMWRRPGCHARFAGISCEGLHHPEHMMTCRRSRRWQGYGRSYQEDVKIPATSAPMRAVPVTMGHQRASILSTNRAGSDMDLKVADDARNRPGPLNIRVAKNRTRPRQRKVRVAA